MVDGRTRGGGRALSHDQRARSDRQRDRVRVRSNADKRRINRARLWYAVDEETETAYVTIVKGGSITIEGIPASLARSWAEKL
jgi:hypothetical protein